MENQINIPRNKSEIIQNTKILQYCPSNKLCCGEKNPFQTKAIYLCCYLCASAAVQREMLRGHVDSCICCGRRDHGSMRRLLLSIQQTSSPPAAAQQVLLPPREASLHRPGVFFAGADIFTQLPRGSSWSSGSFQLSLFI